MTGRYGEWPSPISAAVVAAQGLRLGSVSVDRGDVYWIEGRPSEAGRNALVRRRPDGATADVLPAIFNVRTRVHEYGGGAYVVHEGRAYCSNFADGRLYVASGSEAPRPLTPPGEWRYADAVVDAPRARLICVREDHTAGSTEPINTIVSIGFDAAGAGDTLVSGCDFYSTPRLSADGRRVCWLCWSHPQMPWDGTELWTADVDAAGRFQRARLVAGGPSESIYQPGWSPDGTLYFVSDRTGWWLPYRLEDAPRSRVRPVLVDPPPETEFGRPQWAFGTASLAWAGDRLVAACTTHGRWRLGTIDLAAGSWEPLQLDLEPLDWLAATSTHAIAVAAGAGTPPAVVAVDLATSEAEILRHASDPATIDQRYVARAEPFTYAGSAGRDTHAFFYAPRHPLVSAGADERPPLIAVSHGGPTDAARATFDLRVQYWTSRGFAVVDVNYGGSSGFGREYRQRLNGAWGFVDVEDVIAAARHLVARGDADPHRLIVRGGSAGGYTTLAALAFHPGVFAAGASYYGVSDLAALARDTHKFESRYVEALVRGSDQEAEESRKKEEYRRRSPIHALDRLSCALILFQGLEDRVVPPSQSEEMADAVRRKGLPVAYVAFDGEQHGFRRAESIVRSLESELFFYGAVFGFTPAGTLPRLTIDNLPGFDR